jgi:hypothetical protein
MPAGETIGFAAESGDAAAWNASEMRARTSNVGYLTPSDLEEIEAAMRHLARTRLRPAQIGRATFRLDHLADTLRQITRELESGCGYYLIRGLPVTRYSADEVATMLCGIGSHIGRVMPQDSAGRLIHHVRAEVPASHADRIVRGHRLEGALPFHSDSCDIAALLCVGAADRGGLSAIASSYAVHDALAAEDPDALAVLYRPFHIDRHGDHDAVRPPYYSTPVFMRHNGRLFSRFNPGYVYSAQRYRETPRLTAQQIDAMEAFHRMCASPRFRFDVELMPGDLQLLNNNTTVHARSAYRDGAEGQRHLLRAWLFTARIEDIPPPMRDRFRDMENWRSHLDAD